MSLLNQNHHLLGSRYPQDVEAFARQHGLTDKLNLVVELMNQTFPKAESLAVDLEHDPESSDIWIAVDVVVKGVARDVRLCHRDLARRLLDLLPWPMSALIRTNYTLAEVP